MSNYIIDAGPAINFLATKNERVLIAGIGFNRFHAPEAVRDEVMRKADELPHLAAAAPLWRKMEPNWITVIPAQRTSSLDRIADILTKKPLPKVPSRAKDSGETYVVVHATEQALNGNRVHVIVDDGGGKELIRRAQQYLVAQRRSNPQVGSVILMTTEQILRSQANTPRIPNKPTMRRIYNELRTVTRGLEHIDTTDMLTNVHWSNPPRK